MRGFQDKCAEAIITSLPSIQLNEVATSDDGLIPVLCKVREHTVPRSNVQLEDICGQLDAIGNADYYHSSRSPRSAVDTVIKLLKARFGSQSSAEVQQAQVPDQGEDDYWSDDDRWDDDDD